MGSPIKAYQEFAISAETGTGELPILAGRAVVYHARSSDMGGWVDTFEPGCFDEFFATDHDILAYYNHDSSLILGRESNGRLQLQLDEEGLLVQVNPTDTSWARDLCNLVKDETVKGMSFGCYITDCYWDLEATPPTRHVTKSEITEVTFTGNPSMEETSALVMRSLDQAKKERESTLAELERVKAERVKQAVQSKYRKIQIQNKYQKLKDKA